jgi:hypothetical protein
LRDLPISQGATLPIPIEKKQQVPQTNAVINTFNTLPTWTSKALRNLHTITIASE